MSLQVVTIGGGSGQSTLLRYLKEYPVDISAIVSMVDDGGSTGRLREQLGVLPPGDVRRCILALAQRYPELQDALEYRFKGGDLEGHTLGNILLAALEHTTRNVEDAVRLLGEVFNIQGKVIPVTAESTTLFAQLSNGQTVQGETNIDVPKHDATLAIEKIYLQPKVQATQAAIDAIHQADVIIFTIGDLYTSVIPNLLVQGIPEAIHASQAKLIYACNRSVKPGETHSFTALHFVQTLEKYIGKSLHYIIVDNTMQVTNAETVIRYERSELERHGIEVIEQSLSTEDGLMIDGKKLANALYTLCQRISSI